MNLLLRPIESTWQPVKSKRRRRIVDDVDADDEDVIMVIIAVSES